MEVVTVNQTWSNWHVIIMSMTPTLGTFDGDVATTTGSDSPFSFAQCDSWERFFSTPSMFRQAS
jgi:hypothetical protein